MDDGAHISLAITKGMVAELTLDEARWHELVAGQHEVIAEALRLALAAGDALRAPLELGILLTNDARMAKLNAQFRGRDAATDVLAFPDLEKAAHLGDIALGYGVMMREAAAGGKTLHAHFLHLLVHGVLHLKGYDHQSGAAAREMENRERAILASLGLNDPYLNLREA